MSTNIKLVAMDMDGTLLNDEQRISSRNAKALKEAYEKGIHIAICSGRLCGDSSLFALDAGLTDCHIISLNGAYCLEKPNGRPYAEHTLSKETLGNCLEVLGEYDVTYGCFLQNRMAWIESSERAIEKHWGTYRNREGAPEYLYGKEALKSVISHGIAKIVYVEEEDVGRMEEIRQRLLSVPGLDITASWSDNLELMPKGVNKGSAVKELAGRLGISAENVMTLGDYDNDLSMIVYAGCGIAMGNATEAVKRAAKHITLSNAEDGVAEAIYRFAI